MYEYLYQTKATFLPGRLPCLANKQLGNLQDADKHEGKVQIAKQGSLPSSDIESPMAI